jgi:uncharacterized membrane-anchored protein
LPLLEHRRGPGSIIGANNDRQQELWLAATLKTISQKRKSGARKALLFAVYHPPFSNGGHSGSSHLLAGFDGACQQAGIQSHAVLSGHAHNYQRHTRRMGNVAVPFVVAGTGGPQRFGG